MCVAYKKKFALHLKLSPCATKAVTNYLVLKHFSRTPMPKTVPLNVLDLPLCHAIQKRFAFVKSHNLALDLLQKSIAPKEISYTPSRGKEDAQKFFSIYQWLSIRS